MTAVYQSTYIILKRGSGRPGIDTPKVAKVVDDPRGVAAYMLGRLISEYIIIKSDQTGDRVVPMVPEANKLERNCIDA